MIPDSDTDTPSGTSAGASPGIPGTGPEARPPAGQEAGQEAVRGLLLSRPPFDGLPAAELDGLAASVTVRRLPAGAVLVEPGGTVAAVSLVAAGALEVQAPSGELLSRRGEGEAAGVQAVLEGAPAGNRITALEDTLLYDIPAAEFRRLRATHPAVARFFAPPGSERRRDTPAAPPAGWDGPAGLLGRRLADLIRREPVVVAPEASIAEAARRMRQADISCLPVVAADRLVGIVTDRDLRNRVLAAGLDPSLPVSAVMTPEPTRVEDTALLFEAQILLARHRIHHLPVLRGGRLVGVVTGTDLLRAQGRSFAFLATDVGTREDAAGIAEALRPLPQLVHDLVQTGASAYGIGHAVSALTDAATLRLVELAERRLGPPPVPYAWMALGSQARQEQTVRSDQDNALVIDDAYDPAAHGDWFARFAALVCEGLAAAGYELCPGDMMARNPAWRMPLAAWKETFGRWIRTPEPEALMKASVFFDMRAVAGHAPLVEELQRTVLAVARGNRLFLGHMTGAAMTHRPPLGFFRNLVLIPGGEHRHSLDMKHAGLVPIVDLARLYALDAGLPPVNSRDRLVAAGEAGTVSASGAHDLIDALDFLGLVRLRHQARLLAAGRPPDNYVLPEELSPFDRGHLKDAFAVVKSMQAAALAAYRGGRG